MADKKQNDPGKLLIMQLILDIEELKYFVIEDIVNEKGKDLSEVFSPQYLLCIERYEACEQFMNDTLRNGIFEIIDGSHKVYLEYQNTLKNDDKAFWDKMESEYIPKFTSMYDEVNDGFKNLK